MAVKRNWKDIVKRLREMRISRKGDAFDAVSDMVAVWNDKEFRKAIGSDFACTAYLNDLADGLFWNSFNDLKRFIEKYPNRDTWVADDFCLQARMNEMLSEPLTPPRPPRPKPAPEPEPVPPPPAPVNSNREMPWDVDDALAVFQQSMDDKQRFVLATAAADIMEKVFGFQQENYKRAIMAAAAGKHSNDLLECIKSAIETLGERDLRRLRKWLDENWGSLQEAELELAGH